MHVYAHNIINIIEYDVMPRRVIWRNNRLAAGSIYKEDSKSFAPHAKHHKQPQQIIKCPYAWSGSPQICPAYTSNIV